MIVSFPFTENSEAVGSGSFAKTSMTQLFQLENVFDKKYKSSKKAERKVERRDKAKQTITE